MLLLPAISVDCNMLLLVMNAFFLYIAFVHTGMCVIDACALLPSCKRAATASSCGPASVSISSTYMFFRDGLIQFNKVVCASSLLIPCIKYPWEHVVEDPQDLEHLGSATDTRRRCAWSAARESSNVTAFERTLQEAMRNMTRAVQALRFGPCCICWFSKKKEKLAFSRPAMPKD